MMWVKRGVIALFGVGLVLVMGFNLFKKQIAKRASTRLIGIAINREVFDGQ